MLGIIFAIILLVFSYILLSFSIKITTSANFSLLADRVAKGEISILPATVIVAIFLFFLRELFDSFKNKKEKKRKLFAYKSLISEELKLNYWAQKSLLSIISDIEEQEEKYPEAKYTILVKELDHEYIHGYDGDTLIESRPIPIVHEKQYERLISNIAEQDATLFNLVQNSYNEIRNMAHVRNGLIKGLLAEEYNEPFPHDIRNSGFLDYAKTELIDTYQAMNLLYKECTGKELTEHRLR